MSSVHFYCHVLLVGWLVLYYALFRSLVKRSKLTKTEWCTTMLVIFLCTCSHTSKFHLPLLELLIILLSLVLVTISLAASTLYLFFSWAARLYIGVKLLSWESRVLTTQPSKGPLHDQLTLVYFIIEVAFTRKVPDKINSLFEKSIDQYI